MAYAATRRPTMPIPCEPGVLSVHLTNTAAETNVLVYVPWKNCKLAYAYTVVLVAIDATAAMEIDLELNAAAGTEMMSISVAKSSAVGDIDEATVSSAAACTGLDRDSSARDAINIEVDGSSGAAGSVMLFMYFEPAY